MIDGLTYRSAQGRWVLAAMIGGSAIAAIDATVVGIALPAIGRDFDTGLTTLQWVATAYILTLAGLLLVAGALGDRYGRRRVFTLGVVGFGLASLLCAIAPTPSSLIAARALQGVGAALLTPGSLAIVEATFVAADRVKAIGAWSGLTGVASGVGPFLGGWLVQAGSWRLIFAINIPLAISIAYVARRHVPESRDPAAAGQVDLTGGALVTLGLIGLAYGLIQGSMVAVFSGVGLLVCFIGWERRAKAPIMPLHLFASRQFSAANLVTLGVYGAMGGVMFLLPIELQQVAGFTPLEAGLALLPMTALILLLSERAGAVAGRVGPRLSMSLGPVLIGLGLALFTRISPAGDYVAEVLPAVVALGLGLAVTVAPLTATVLAAVPAEHAGVASAVNSDVARSANLIAVAVIPTAVGLTGAAYLDPTQFADGFRTAAIICAGICLLVGALGAVTIENPSTSPAYEADLVP